MKIYMCLKYVFLLKLKAFMKLKRTNHTPMFRGILGGTQQAVMQIDIQ